MIIELYGLPGSGKTTFARKVKEKYGTVRVKVQKTEILLYNFLFFILHPIKFILLLSFVLNNMSKENLYFKIINNFFVINAKYLKARKYKFAIIDQGYYQNIISVFDEKIDNTLLNKYLTIISRPDVLFVFDVSDKLRGEYIANRGYFGREEYGGDKQRKWQDIINFNNKIFVNQIEENEKLLVINDENINDLSIFSTLMK